MDEYTIAILTRDNDKIAASERTLAYHRSMNSQLLKSLEVAEKARSKGFDPKRNVEIYIAQDVATRTEGLVGPVGVAKRLKEMESEGMVKDEIVISIARQIARGEFGDLTNEDRAEQALRTALSYQTESVTAAPIEGISKVEIKQNPNGTEYLAIYYAGPIRSAGGTAQGVSVYIADVIRDTLGLAEYQASDQEVERMLEEVRLYNSIMHLQLPTSDEEIRHAWRNIPVMISGDPTESEEVSGYRNIESMGSNRVRGGACLVLNDGLVGRSKKIMKRITKLKLQGWDWLQEIANGKYTETRQTDNKDDDGPKKVTPDYSFASDALMGRPTFSDATSTGGFRLRYGHARNTGIAAIGVHPATMAVVDDFLAPGTHVRTERPGKGSIVLPIDSIRPPVVLLKSGEVSTYTTYEAAKAVQDEISEILFMGDMLVGIGEFIQNNYRLCPPGYNEEWWAQELLERGWKGKLEDEHDIEFYNRICTTKPSFKDALQLSKEYNVALHPVFTPAWKYLSWDDTLELRSLLLQIEDNLFPMKAKKFLETLFIPHKIVNGRIDVGEILPALKLQLPDVVVDKGSNGLELVQSICSVKIQDTIGTTVGARMGRPEKAKARLMKPMLHGLFPIGEGKGVRKNLINAMRTNDISVFLSNRICNSCNLHQIDMYCQKCGDDTIPIGICTNRRCGRKNEIGPCDHCGRRVGFTKKYTLEINNVVDKTMQRLGGLGSVVRLLPQLKNPYGIPELLDKGVLRARTNLNVFRDGTIRYDATDAPLTHFYPYEIGTPIEKLKQLGYTHDIYDAELVGDDQLLELKLQDIVVQENSRKHLMDVANFVDQELEYIYNLDKFYNFKSSDEIVGQLVIGLAPHTSAGVVGRIIGFTRSSLCWAHPFWHSSKRRNADGDEDGIILLMDGLLNFSKEFLPTTRGSKMDTPLVLVATLNPNEVDDEAFNLDDMISYGVKFYEIAQQMKMPSEISDMIKRAQHKLGTEDQFENFKFSHHTSNISAGPLVTRYKDSELGIRDKLHIQLNLAKKIRAVNARDTALRVFEKHTLPDLQGNLRAFASQKFRCVTCNSKYRRVPLTGRCKNDKCEKSKIILTVPPKGVSKYFDICQMLVMDYKLGIYHENRLERIKISLDSLFHEERLKAVNLEEWF